METWFKPPSLQMIESAKKPFRLKYPYDDVEFNAWFQLFKGPGSLREIGQARGTSHEQARLIFEEEDFAELLGVASAMERRIAIAKLYELKAGREFIDRKSHLTRVASAARKAGLSVDAVRIIDGSRPESEKFSPKRLRINEHLCLVKVSEIPYYSNKSTPYSHLVLTPSPTMKCIVVVIARRVEPENWQNFVIPVRVLEKSRRVHIYIPFSRNAHWTWEFFEAWDLLKAKAPSSGQSS